MAPLPECSNSNKHAKGQYDYHGFNKNGKKRAPDRQTIKALIEETKRTKYEWFDDFGRNQEINEMEQEKEDFNRQFKQAKQKSRIKTLLAWAASQSPNISVIEQHLWDSLIPLVDGEQQKGIDVLKSKEGSTVEELAQLLGFTDLTFLKNIREPLPAKPLQDHDYLAGPSVPPNWPVSPAPSSAATTLHLQRRSKYNDYIDCLIKDIPVNICIALRGLARQKLGVRAEGFLRRMEMMKESKLSELLYEGESMKLFGVPLVRQNRANNSQNNEDVVVVPPNTVDNSPNTNSTPGSSRTFSDSPPLPEVNWPSSSARPSDTNRHQPYRGPNGKHHKFIGPFAVNPQRKPPMSIRSNELHVPRGPVRNPPRAPTRQIVYHPGGTRYYAQPNIMKDTRYTHCSLSTVRDLVMKSRRLPNGAVFDPRPPASIQTVKQVAPQIPATVMRRLEQPPATQDAAVSSSIPSIVQAPNPAEISTAQKDAQKVAHIEEIVPVAPLAEQEETVQDVQEPPPSTPPSTPPTPVEPYTCQSGKQAYLSTLEALKMSENLGEKEQEVQDVQDVQEPPPSMPASTPPTPAEPNMDESGKQAFLSTLVAPPAEQEETVQDVQEPPPSMPASTPPTPAEALEMTGSLGEKEQEVRDVQNVQEPPPPMPASTPSTPAEPNMDESGKQAYLSVPLAELEETVQDVQEPPPAVPSASLTPAESTSCQSEKQAYLSALDALEMSENLGGQELEVQDVQDVQDPPPSMPASTPPTPAEPASCQSGKQAYLSALEALEMTENLGEQDLNDLCNGFHDVENSPLEPDSLGFKGDLRGNQMLKNLFEIPMVRRAEFSCGHGTHKLQDNVLALVPSVEDDQTKPVSQSTCKCICAGSAAEELDNQVFARKWPKYLITAANGREKIQVSGEVNLISMLDMAYDPLKSSSAVLTELKTLARMPAQRKLLDSTIRQSCEKHLENLDYALGAVEPKGKFEKTLNSFYRSLSWWLCGQTELKGILENLIKPDGKRALEQIGASVLKLRLHVYKDEEKKWEIYYPESPFSFGCVYLWNKGDNYYQITEVKKGYFNYKLKSVVVKREDGSYECTKNTGEEIEPCNATLMFYSRELEPID